MKNQESNSDNYPSSSASRTVIVDEPWWDDWDKPFTYTDPKTGSVFTGKEATDRYYDSLFGKKENKSLRLLVKKHLGALVSKASVVYEKAKIESTERLKQIKASMGYLAVKSTIETLISDESSKELLGGLIDREDLPTGVERTVEPLTTDDASLEISPLILNAVKSIENTGYAWLAPDIDQQARESDRTNIIRYLPSRRAAWGADTMGDVDSPVEVTEQQAIQSLISFLDQYIKDSEDEAATSSSVRKNREKAIAMRENLTYIGEKEYKLACEVIGQMWKTFLDENHDNIICVMTKINEATGNSNTRKSDSYLFDNILSTFTEEELDEYGDRIITELKDLPRETEPEHIKVVFLDDWTISGSQMRSQYSYISQDPEFSKFTDCIEIHLITASESRINNGLKVSSYDFQGLNKGRDIKVKAVYKSHHSDKSEHEHKGHVSGSHSSVDFDFEVAIEIFVDDYRYGTVNYSDPSVKSRVMPAGTNIVREYRRTKQIHVSDNGRIRRRR